MFKKKNKKKKKKNGEIKFQLLIKKKIKNQNFL